MKYFYSKIFKIHALYLWIIGIKWNEHGVEFLYPLPKGKGLQIWKYFSQVTRQEFFTDIKSWSEHRKVKIS